MGVKTRKITNSASTVDVRDFAPGGTLTYENFDTAIRAAITKAYTMVGSSDSTIGENAIERYAGISIFIPSGQWLVRNTLFFPATYPKPTPGLVGEAPGAVTLLYDTSTLTGPTISCGSEVPGGELSNYTYAQMMKNFDIRFIGDACTHGSIRSRFSLHCKWEDVSIRGVGQFRKHSRYEFNDWEKEIGFDFGTSPDGFNQQHLSLTRAHAYYCRYGARIGAGSWTCTAKELNVDGSRYGVIVDGGAALHWWGGSAQGTTDAIVSSGTEVVIASGTGASIEAANGGFTTVTGLSDLRGFTRTHIDTYKGSWLEIVDTTYNYPGGEVWDEVGGLYRIEDVINATSLRLRKASTHGARSGTISWRLLGCGGSQNVHLQNVYYEGPPRGAYAYMHVATHMSLPGNAYWCVDGCWAWGPSLAVRAEGFSGDIIFKNCVLWYETCEIERSRFGTFRFDDREVSTCKVDSISRRGLIARYNRTHEDATGAVWDSRPRSVRLNRCVVERGAVFALDARKASTIARTGNDVTGWTDLIGGVVGTQQQSGIAPQYNAADAKLGPVVTITHEAVQASQAGLTFTLTGSFPTGKFCVPTILLVGRVPDTAIAGRQIGLRATEGNELITAISINDGGWYPAGWYATYYTPELGNALNSGPAVPNDTEPHVLVTSSSMSGKGVISVTDTGETFGYGGGGGFGPRGEFGLTGGEAVTFKLPYWTGQPTGSFHVAYVAIFPDALTIEECQYLTDLAKNEFKIA